MRKGLHRLVGRLHRRRSKRLVRVESFEARWDCPSGFFFCGVVDDGEPPMDADERGCFLWIGVQRRVLAVLFVLGLTRAVFCGKTLR